MRFRPLPAAAALCAALLVGIVLLRAGMTRLWVDGIVSEMAGIERRPIELNVWDFLSPTINEEYGRYYDVLESTFEARYPDVDVVYQFVPFVTYTQKIPTAMVGPNPPDVFQSSVWFSEGFYHRGMLRPLNDLLERNRSDPPDLQVGEEAFLPSVWRHNHTEDGVVFGIPQIIDAYCLLWNLDILEKAAAKHKEIRDMFARRPDGSVDFDRLRFDAVRDWDHFRAIAKLLTNRYPDGRMNPAGFVIRVNQWGAAEMFEPWLVANGGRFQHPAGKRAEFNNPRGVQTVHFLGRLYWEDRVCSPFRRDIGTAELFERGEVAVTLAGTWSAKDIIRDTIGWRHFAMTAFPPGPQGDGGHKTVCWGNMLVISRSTRKLDAAWRYLRFVTSLEGNLIRLKVLGYNGPRRDFYQTQAWKDTVANRPFISNVEQICRVAEKLRHTDAVAVHHQSSPMFETMLRRYPEIVAGRGPYGSVEDALEDAADKVNRIYDRYNRQIVTWGKKRSGGT